MLKKINFKQEWWKFALLGLGIGVFFQRKAIMNFAINLAKLPSSIRGYWVEAQSAGARYGIDPALILGIMWRESNAGLALSPVGPGGTGDFGPRNLTRYPMAGPNGLPPDGGGWGRGLMQIDYGAHNAWVLTHDWKNPAVNIDKGAQILKSNFDYFKAKGLKGDALTDAALAAYNAGPANVWNAVSKGLPASSVTTGGDYAPWIRNWLAKFA